MVFTVFQHRFSAGVGITIGAPELAGVVDPHVHRHGAAAVFPLRGVFFPAFFESEDFIDERSIDTASGEDAVFLKINRFGTGKGVNAVLFGQGRDLGGKSGEKLRVGVVQPVSEFDALGCGDPVQVFLDLAVKVEKTDDQPLGKPRQLFGKGGYFF